MIRLLLFLPFAAMLVSCGSLQPVNDSAERATLVLPREPSPAKLYPAPVFTVSVPTFLNESTVWYSDDSGVLTNLSDYLWAETLSKSLRQELTLGLAREEPFSTSSRIDVYFARFILLADGSATAIAEVRFSTPDSEQVLPLISVSQKNVWNPDNPESYLSGYQTLLKSTIDEIRSALSSTPPAKEPAKDSSE